MTIHPHCRFCRSQLSIPLPDPQMLPDLDVKIVTKLAVVIGKLAGRACCDRCADYHRALDDRAGTTQHLALMLERADQDASAGIRKAIGAILRLVVEKAEAHYLISGLAAEHGSFVALILEKPAYAGHYVRDFDKRAAALAAKTHAPQEQEIEYAY